MEETGCRPIYSQNGNWNRIDWRGNQNIFRILAEEKDKIHVISIGYVEDGVFKLHPTPKTQRRRAVWTRRRADEDFRKGELFHIDERGLPEPMKHGVPPKAGQDLHYDKRKAAVDYIEAKWGDDVLKDKECYRRAIKNTAAHFNTDEQSVRKWYEQFLFFGRHKNALIAQNWNKGGPGKGRRGLKDENGDYVMQGRPTKKQLDDESCPELRQLLSPALHREYSAYLRMQAWGTDDRFPVVYTRFKAQRYAFNRDPTTGEKVAHQIKLARLPKDKYMKRVGREIFRNERIERDLARRQSNGSRQRFTTGSARDIVHDQIPVLDIDATSVSNGVLFPDLPEEIIGHGRPTVLLAVDRGSSAITGWHVTFEPENANGYLACVFSAYTPKERELMRWEVPYLKGFVYGCTAKIFVDRGPGIHKKVQAAAVERLKVSMLIAAPYRPQAKGTVEGAMGSTQRDLSDLPGSTFTTGDANKDKVQRNAAKKEAVSLKVFMQRLLISISKRNLAVSTVHVLTPHMLKQKVIPCPADVYWYNKGRIRGDASQDWAWSSEKIFRMLCVKRVLKAPGGMVTLNNLHFTSSALEQLVFRHVARHGATPEVTIYQVPNSTTHMLWEQPNGTLSVLEATVQTNRAYGDGTEFTIEVSNRKRNSLAHDGQVQARANEQEIINRRPGRLSKAKMKKVADVDKHAEGYIQPPMKEQRKSATVKLNTDNFTTTLETIGVTPPPPREDVAIQSLYPLKKKQRLLVEF